ncbi:ret finger protein-like 4B [Sorex araneus]|uniref:ret finger protein-like 4B n=1 Tax=Sorex araneus TaxID=42254 RepID=UPI002433B71B|nr:ret finger protein-like 4B [Sorex araneus]
MAHRLQKQATCSICLEIFSNPLSTVCGHTFCSACWNKCEANEDGAVPCPFCRTFNRGPAVEERQITMLTVLVKQHCPFLERKLHIKRSELPSSPEDLKLDAASANSLLVLSDDLKSVRCGKIRQTGMKNPQRFTRLPCVLGAASFSTGCHYWEVEVGQGKGWSLGVCVGSVNRNRKTLSSECGFWIITKNEETYTSSNRDISVSASPDLIHVGIFLDVEMEEISFFDVRSNILICSFSQVSCSEPLRPFFCPEMPGEGSDLGAPLTICPREVEALP